MARAETDRGQSVWIALIAVIMITAAAFVASSVFAPLALALLVACQPTGRVTATRSASKLGFSA